MSWRPTSPIKQLDIGVRIKSHDPVFYGGLVSLSTTKDFVENPDKYKGIKPTDDKTADFVVAAFAGIITTGKYALPRTCWRIGRKNRNTFSCVALPPFSEHHRALQLKYQYIMCGKVPSHITPKPFAHEAFEDCSVFRGKPVAVLIKQTGKFTVGQYRHSTDTDSGWRVGHNNLCVFIKIDNFDGKEHLYVKRLLFIEYGF